MSESTSSTLWYNDSLTSQKQLEEVIWSRLVETYLTFSLPCEELPSSAFAHPPVLDTRKAKAVTGSHGHLKTSSSSPTTASRHSRQGATMSPQGSPGALSPLSTDLTLPSPNVSGRQQPLAKDPFPCSPPLTPPPESALDTPIFISPIHRPSTNPKFIIDPDISDLSRLADPSIESAVVRLWGHVGTEWGVPSDPTGKGKAREPDLADSKTRWKIIAEWKVHLDMLKPLPDEVSGPSL